MYVCISIIYEHTPKCKIADTLKKGSKKVLYQCHKVQDGQDQYSRVGCCQRMNEWSTEVQVSVTNEAEAKSSVDSMLLRTSLLLW